MTATLDPMNTSYIYILLYFKGVYQIVLVDWTPDNHLKTALIDILFPNKLNVTMFTEVINQVRSRVHILILLIVATTRVAARRPPRPTACWPLERMQI